MPISHVDNETDVQTHFEYERSGPLPPELTEEMLGGLGDFLYGREQPAKQLEVTTEMPLEINRSGPGLVLAGVGFCAASSSTDSPSSGPVEHPQPPDCSENPGPFSGFFTDERNLKDPVESERKAFDDVGEDSFPEGSTAVPSTAEASVSRWSEHTSDQDCKAASPPDQDCKAAPPPTAEIRVPTPGLCVLNLETGITRFLHEAEDVL